MRRGRARWRLPSRRQRARHARRRRAQPRVRRSCGERAAVLEARALIRRSRRAIGAVDAEHHERRLEHRAGLDVERSERAIGGGGDRRDHRARLGSVPRGADVDGRAADRRAGGEVDNVAADPDDSPRAKLRRARRDRWPRRIHRVAADAFEVHRTTGQQGDQAGDALHDVTTRNPGAVLPRDIQGAARCRTTPGCAPAQGTSGNVPGRGDRVHTYSREAHRAGRSERARGDDTAGARASGATIGALDLCGVYLGDSSACIAPSRSAGRRSAVELVSAAGVNERYAIPRDIVVSWRAIEIRWGWVCSSIRVAARRGWLGICRVRFRPWAGRSRWRVDRSVRLGRWATPSRCLPVWTSCRHGMTTRWRGGLGARIRWMRRFRCIRRLRRGLECQIAPSRGCLRRRVSEWQWHGQPCSPSPKRWHKRDCCTSIT